MGTFEYSVDRSKVGTDGEDDHGKCEAEQLDDDVGGNGRGDA